MHRIFNTVLFCCILISPAAAKNIIYKFGPESDTVIVLTASLPHEYSGQTGPVSALTQLAEEFSVTPPEISVMIAITGNDKSILPASIPVKRYEGTKELIQKISAYPNAMVCVFDSGSSESAKIIGGVTGLTSPPWLLKSVYKTLIRAQLPVDFSPQTMIFHRIGWIQSDPVLQLYAHKHIPFIKIETDHDIAAFLRLLPQSIHTNFTKEWDMHYLVHKIQNQLIILQENIIVSIIIFTAMGILFWLMLFSFLFGHKTQQHIKDLLDFWWIPIYFFAVNYISFFLSGSLTQMLFFLRFGTSTAINNYPLTALVLKYTFTVLGIIISALLTTRMPLPQSRLIYGFFASTVCLINIFIFSVFNFSFSIAFLLIYFISLAAHKCNNISLQIMFLLLLFLPLQPFGSHIFNYNTILFKNIFFRNIEPTFIFIPFDLLLARLFLSIKGFRYKRTKPFSAFYLPAILFCSIVLLIMIIPFPSISPHGDFILLQKIHNIKTSFVKKHITNDKKNIELPKHAVKQTKQCIANAYSFLTVNTTLRNYFERSIGSITINTALKPQSFILTLTAQTGTIFFEADQPVERRENRTIFVSTPNPKLPFSIHFSSTKNAVFDVDVKLWSTENPCGIVLVQPEQKHTTLPFLFEVETSFSIKTETQR